MGASSAQAEPGKPRSVRRHGRRPTIGAVSSLGFALVLALWAVAGYLVLGRIDEVERHASESTLRYVRSEELLSALRREVLLGSILYRDVLFKSDPQHVERARQQLIESHDRLDRAFDEYTALVGREPEPEALTRLRRELDDRWTEIAPVLDPSPTQTTLAAVQRLREQVVPRREAIGQISDRMHAINREAFERQRREVTQVYRATQQRVWLTGAAALLLGLIIAILVTRYAARLEARVRDETERNAQSTRELQRLSAQLVRAHEDERRTIARELHDEVGQALTAVKAELAVTQRELNAGTAAQAQLAEARSVTEHALQTVRDLSQLLRPSVLDDLGLAAAVASYLRAFSRRTGLRTDFVDRSSGERLATEVETCAYRIVQEATTNTARHAEASQVRVVLEREDGLLRVTVDDDGKGFDAACLSDDGVPPGVGLLGIRERVADFHGGFHLTTAPGQGTFLSVELPALSRVTAQTDGPRGAVPFRPSAVIRQAS